jgi:integrase
LKGVIPDVPARTGVRADDRGRRWRALVGVPLPVGGRDFRHTFATFALRAGIPTFDLSRYMGASLTMIDRHYGHLARDGREHAIHLLDALNGRGYEPWMLVNAAWTSNEQRQQKRRLSREETEAL